MAPVRLAILEADRPAYKSITSQGHYTGVFTALLRAATAPVPLEAIFTVTGHNIIEHPDTEYPPLDEVDAILISGSKYSAYQDDPWILKLVEYTEKAIASERVRVVGVCFGHQIVGRALGCVVQGSPEGWEVAVYEVPLSEKGKEVFGMEKIRIHQMHRDEVATMPEGALLLGSTDKCKVQGMFLPGRYITVQGHPEFTRDIVSEIVDFRHEGGIFDDALYNDAMQRVVREQDGVDVARAFVKFMLAGQQQEKLESI